MDWIKSIFPDSNVLLYYRCGSKAFGTDNENSDSDFIAVIDNFKGMTYIKEDDKECFVYDLETWKKKITFDDSISEYHEVFNFDEIFTFDTSIIYVDDSVKPFIKELKENYLIYYDKWVKRVVDYFDFFIGMGGLNKNFYHLLRFRTIVGNYKKSGSFSLDLGSKKSHILRYKNGDREPFRKEINQAINYFKKEAGL